MKTYLVNEIFYSIQGEGARAGTANVFVRFSGCNLRCAMEPGPRSPGGFDCDTEFLSGTRLTAEQIMDQVEAYGKEMNVVLTGGEPLLQVDMDLLEIFGEYAGLVAIETNGTVAIDPEIIKGEWVDYVAVSPKTAEHTLRIHAADEVRYVRNVGQPIPRVPFPASYYYLSPAFDGMELNREALSWCIKLVKENPEWRLSVQQHKLWGVR